MSKRQHDEGAASSSFLRRGGRPASGRCPGRRAAALAFCCLFFSGCSDPFVMESKSPPAGQQAQTRALEAAPEGEAEKQSAGSAEGRLSAPFSVAGQQATGANPFMGAVSPQAAAGPAVSGAAPTPLRPSSFASPALSLQLPQLPTQEAPAVESTTIPSWSAQPSVLAMGAPTRWQSLVDLKVTGIIFSPDGGRKRALIEETLLQKPLAPTREQQAQQQQQLALAQAQGTGQTAQVQQQIQQAATFEKRSYVVHEGEVFSEWQFRVDRIHRDYVVVRKGADRVVLPLTANVRAQGRRISNPSPIGVAQPGGTGTTPFSSSRPIGTGESPTGVGTGGGAGAGTSP